MNHSKRITHTYTPTGVMSAWTVKSNHWTCSQKQQWWQKGKIMSLSDNVTLTGQRVDRAPWPSRLMKLPSAGSIMGVRGSVGASPTRSLLSASSLQFGAKDTLKGCRWALIWRLWLQNAIRGRPCLHGWLSRGLLHSHMSPSRQANRHNYFLISPS